MGVGVGLLLVGHLLLTQSHLVLMLHHLDVVGDGGGVASVGRELVVVWPVRLQHLNDVKVLSLECDHHGGPVQVVQESGVGKHVQQVAGTLSGPLPAGQEQRRLTLENAGVGLNQ